MRGKEETFCQEIALNAHSVAAYRRAGWGGKIYHTDRGNAARLMHRPRIADRIAYLRRQEEEIFREKFRRIEQTLWAMHDANEADLWEVYWTEKRDRDGDIVFGEDGKAVMVKRMRMRTVDEIPDHALVAVESINLTEDGRLVPKRYSRLTANAELRKLYGMGSTERESAGGEFAKMGDTELISELNRQAKELGISVNLTYSFGAP